MKRRQKVEKIIEGPGPCVLAVDPSLTAFGWAVVPVKTPTIVYLSGCIKTKSSDKKLKIRKGDQRIARVQIINKNLLDLIREIDIVLIVAEQPHGSQSAGAAVSLGLMIGILQTLSDSFDLPIEWYSEHEAKKFNLQNHKVTKLEMIEAMSSIFSNWHLPGYGNKAINEAVADSLAVYNTALFYSPLLKYLKNEPRNIR